MKAIITVPEPCHENWDAMQPAEQGRHCTACALTVVDFTDWELADISLYLRVHAGQRVCGRFNNTQLNQPFDLTKFAPEIIRWKTNGLYKIAALIVVCFALATSSCNTSDPTNGEPQTQQKVPDNLVGVVIPNDIISMKEHDTAIKKSPVLIKNKKSKKTDDIGIMTEGPSQSQGVPVMEYRPEMRSYPVPGDSTPVPTFIGPPPEPPDPIKGNSK